MGKKRKHLSHEEVWDDSALVDSWDAALQEYQLYHSIHARGERVEDVLEEAEAAEESLPNGGEKSGHSPSDIVNGLHSEDLEDGEVEDDRRDNGSIALPGITDEPGRTKKEILAELPSEPPPPTPGDGAQDAPALSGMLGALMNGVQDESLKNLMMSWYYAGYYTGLYEGRQQSSNGHTNGVGRETTGT